MVNAGFSKRKGEIFELNGGFSKRKCVILGIMGYFGRENARFCGKCGILQEKMHDLGVKRGISE